MVKKNSIPERWRSLKAVGQRVPGSRFIAFKVPLKGATSQRVTQNQKFTPKDLLTAIRNQNEELGLIIDLTNTERYYTTKDLPKSVQYVKLHTAGLKIPDDATIHQFKRVVRRFLFAHEDDDKIIGVHCTTGINRTGYLICRYLIDIEGWRPLHSISAFAQARGHPIEGAVYIEDLIKGAPRSNVGIDTPPTDEERRALESTEEFPWERGQRSILEPSNEFGDFDARGGRPGEDYHDPRGGGRNILGDHDLRLPREPQQGRGYMDDRPRPMHPSERFGRPDMEGRFNPEMQNRRDFHGPGPRPLMNMQGGYGPRTMQRPYEGAGMGQEDMDYDMRGRGRPNAPHSHEEYDNTYSHPVPPYARNKMGNPMYNEGEEEEEEAEEYPYEDYEEEGPGYDPNEGMGNPYQGPPNERMNPNARPMQGMHNRMGPRDPHFMGAPQNKRFPGPMNERMAPRNARPMGPPGGANAREGGFMEGPGNSQYVDESMNDFTSGEVPMNKRMHPNAGRRMGMPMNEGGSQGHMPQRGAQGVNKPMYDRMQGARGMDDSVNDQGYQSYSQTYNEPVTYPRNPKPFDGSQSYQRDSQAMDMNKMYPRDPQGMEGPMNEWGPMEGMHPRGNKFGMNKPRPADGPVRQNFSGDARNFEGRNAPEGPNRYTPYPPRKPMQAPQTMGAPGGDQYSMAYPTHGY